MKLTLKIYKGPSDDYKEVKSIVKSLIKMLIESVKMDTSSIVKRSVAKIV